MCACVIEQCLMARRLPLKTIIFPLDLKIVFDGCCFALILSSWNWRTWTSHICCWTCSERILRAVLVLMTILFSLWLPRVAHYGPSWRTIWKPCDFLDFNFFLPFLDNIMCFWTATGRFKTHGNVQIQFSTLLDPSHDFANF
jgi:hypothetical protein